MGHVFATTQYQYAFFVPAFVKDFAVEKLRMKVTVGLTVLSGDGGLHPIVVADTVHAEDEQMLKVAAEIAVKANAESIRLTRKKIHAWDVPANLDQWDVIGHPVREERPNVKTFFGET